MKGIYSIVIVFLAWILFSNVLAQVEEDSTNKSTAIEGLKYKQQPGLALAASKIFFSDKRYSISGFGEFNYIPVQTGVNTNLGDLELYYSGLYRFATFFGYRLRDNLIWNSEFQIELLHEKTNEVGHEIVVEAFVDWLFKDYFNARLGFYPLTIGYVNNNDEPVMFYSVNRSDVERIITPSTWIEFGTMFYGSIREDLSYALGISQGLTAKNYMSGTWIRQGRSLHLDVPKSVSINPQLTYTGIENLTLSTSGYFGKSGQGEHIEIDGVLNEVEAPIALYTAYAKYDWKNFRFVTTGSYGRLGETDKIAELTNIHQGEHQILGREVYGVLAEIGVDVLPYFRKNKERENKHNWFWSSEDLKLTVFGRYERLNTHLSIDQSLLLLPRVQKDLDVYTIGLNFNTRENIVFKTNYRFSSNRYQEVDKPINHLVELGIGFIF